MMAGQRVDVVVDAAALVERFGPASFDVVLTTEMLEHVRNWPVVISNLKQVLRPGGVLLVTTRSIGFHYHGWPYDFWRYEPEDMRVIFGDMDIEVLESDPEAPGVFMLARQRVPFSESRAGRRAVLDGPRPPGSPGDRAAGPHVPAPSLARAAGKDKPADGRDRGQTRAELRDRAGLGGVAAGRAGRHQASPAPELAQMRTIQQRKADVLAALERNADLWLATASPTGRPHLVAVSAWFHDPDFLIATVGSSRTARNLDATEIARLALGAPDDVIVIDARLTASMPVTAAEADLLAGFATAVGWSPVEEPGNWRFFRLVPTRIQAYRGYGELEGRDVFSDGRWLA